jgi:UDP-N-acetylmuramate dehydrogenase
MADPRSEEPGTSLAELTTIGVGGEPHRMLEATTEAELAATAGAVFAAGDAWLLLGGGSNTVAADEPFDGTVIRVMTRGVELLGAGDAPDTVRLRVQAGESWDDLVALAVANRWSGIEALSGIPGSVGAAPVQNIGAYGQELSSVLVAIDFIDAAAGERRRIEASELELGYRTSVLKRGLAGVVLAVELDLVAQQDVPGAALSAPVVYPQLADALGIALGTSVSLGELRRTVLRLRASKGMVLDAGDPDSRSAGSFFTNPVVTEQFARSLPAESPRWPFGSDEPDLVAALDAPSAEQSESVGLLAAAAAARTRRAAQNPRLVKLSAAWLIENAGIGRGFALPDSGAAISSKHTLAIVNRGDASAQDIASLAGYVQARVQSEFGVMLQPEPVLVGLDL